MLSFLEDNCLIFDTEDENKFEYTKVHQAFKDLFEKLFAEMIKDLGITEADFVKACENAYGRPESRPIVEQMIAVDDFESFKKQMVKRNQDLNEYALRLLSKQKERKEDKKISSAEQAKLEEEELAAAIKESLTLEENRKKMEDEEQKMLNEAIKLSMQEQVFLIVL